MCATVSRHRHYATCPPLRHPQHQLHATNSNRHLTASKRHPSPYYKRTSSPHSIMKPLDPSTPRPFATITTTTTKTPPSATARGRRSAGSARALAFSPSGRTSSAPATSAPFARARATRCVAHAWGQAHWRPGAAVSHQWTTRASPTAAEAGRGWHAGALPWRCRLPHGAGSRSRAPSCASVFDDRFIPRVGFPGL